MTKEYIIKELKEMKQERMVDLIKIDAKHDVLVEVIAHLNYLISEAENNENG